MRKAYKVRIYPNQTIKEKFQQSSNNCQLVYNWGLNQRREANKNKQKQPSKYEQKRQLRKFKEQYPHLKKTYSQVLQNVVFITLPNAWKKYQE